MFSKAQDRPYNYISKKDNKTKNLRNNMRIKHFESGNSLLKEDYGIKITCRVQKKKELKISPLEFRKLTKTQKTRLMRPIKNTLQINEKIYEVIRLLFLVKINKAFPKLSKSDYLLQFVKYPHQILRLKSVASSQKGISVDRISTGMKNAFGKPFCMASRIVKDNDIFFQCFFNHKYERDALKIRDLVKSLCHKVPFTPKIEVQINNKTQSNSEGAIEGTHI